MAGILYGVGVGPGDPELLTLQAVRIIKECDIILVPGEIPKDTVAYKIAAGGVPEISDKPVTGVSMPMTKDPEKLKHFHAEAVTVVRQLLEEGRKIAFLTLGDPCIYSTYIYIHKEIKKLGYETQIINGIPSFLAVSAKLNEGLVEKAQMLHIVPATYQVEEGLTLSGTKVLMKTGKKAGQVRKYLQTSGMEGKVVECCGMAGETVYEAVSEIPDDLSYYSVMVIKDREET